MFGLALHKLGDTEKRDMIIQNIEQFLVQDDENQTAYLKLPDDNCWWCWYGSEYEAQAYYLKLLGADRPEGREGVAPGEVPPQQPQARDLLEQHARHGRLHRGLRRLPQGQRRGQAGHDRDDLLDGQGQGSQDHAENLFTFDNKLVLDRRRSRDGKHTHRVPQEGHGPALLQRLPDQLHAGRPDHAGRAWRSRSTASTTSSSRSTRRSRSKARAARRWTRRSRSTSARNSPTWRRSRAATWSRSSWRSTARTTTSTSCSRT